MRIRHAGALLAAACLLAASNGARAQDEPCLAPVPTYRMSAVSMAPAIMGEAVLQARCWPHAVPGAAADPAGIRLGTLDPGLRRGDIVLFAHPRRGSGTWVKRVIGLPGDRVALRGGRLWLNGVQVPREDAGTEAIAEGSRPARPLRRYREILPGSPPYEILELSDTQPFDTLAELVVPEDMVFVLGDNRDNSLDSRALMAFGFVPASHLVGVVTRILGSSH